MKYLVNHKPYDSPAVAKQPDIHPAAARIVLAIVKERKRQKVSRYRLSQISGVSQQMIGYVEKGERVPSLEVVCRLVAGLGMSLKVNRDSSAN